MITQKLLETIDKIDNPVIYISRTINFILPLKRGEKHIYIIEIKESDEHPETCNM